MSMICCIPSSARLHKLRHQKQRLTLCARCAGRKGHALLLLVLLNLLQLLLLLLLLLRYLSGELAGRPAGCRSAARRCRLSSRSLPRLLQSTCQAPAVAPDEGRCRRGHCAKNACACNTGGARCRPLAHFSVLAPKPSSSPQCMLAGWMLCGWRRMQLLLRARAQTCACTACDAKSSCARVD